MLIATFHSSFLLHVPLKTAVILYSVLAKKKKKKMQHYPCLLWHSPKKISSAATGMGMLLFSSPDGHGRAGADAEHRGGGQELDRTTRQQQDTPRHTHPHTHSTDK